LTTPNTAVAKNNTDTMLETIIPVPPLFYGSIQCFPLIVALNH